MTSRMNFKIKNISNDKINIDKYGTEPKQIDNGVTLSPGEVVQFAWSLPQISGEINITITLQSGEISHYYTIRTIGDFCWFILTLRHDFADFIDIVSARPDPVTLIKNILG